MTGSFVQCGSIFKALTVVILIAPSFVECQSGKKIPDFIHLCKRNDPNLDQCLLETVESLRPKFATGVPEIGIPALDPLFLPQIVIFNGEKGEIKVIANNVKVTGVKNAKILSLNIDLDKLEMKGKVHFPTLNFEGQYDINARLISFPLKGKGPLRGNATEVTADAVMKGKIVTQNETRYLEMISAEVNVSLKGYRIRVEKLFPDKKLNEAVNKIMNDQNVVPLSAIKPLLDKVAAKMLVSMVNKLSKNIPYDDLFAP